MMHLTRFTLVLTLVFFSACGDDATSPTVERAPPGEAEAITLDGVYSVPVDDPVLEPFASQPVVLDWRERNGRYRLDYDFPTDLTGVSQRVELEGVRAPGGTIELVGALGVASCEPSASGAEIACTERFLDMQFDLVRLQRDLERRGLPIVEIERRLDVAALFRSDPIGVLSFAVD